MRRPTRSSLLLVLTLLATLAAALYLRVAIPPAAARLLPECDAIVYANQKPVRAATHFDRSPSTRSPDFQQFIDATGIFPERDLDDAAFALHRIADPTGPNGPVAYSEVFEGRFDPARLTRYLTGIASARETYASREIFTIRVGDQAGTRNLRVALLGRHIVVASNAPTPEQIHAMLDRNRSAINPFGGPTLLSGLYGEVPAFASAWAIGQLGLPFSESGFVNLLGLRLPLPEATTFVAGARYLGSVQLRVEAVASTRPDALRTAQALSSILSLLNAAERGPSTGNPLRAMLDTLKIVPDKDRVVVTVNIPVDLLRRLATPVPSAASHEYLAPEILSP